MSTNQEKNAVSAEVFLLKSRNQSIMNVNAASAGMRNNNTVDNKGPDPQSVIYTLGIRPFLRFQIQSRRGTTKFLRNANNM